MDTASYPILKPLLFIAALGDEAVALAMPTVHALRLSGIRVDTDYTGASLKSQMKKADKTGANYTLIIGDQEIKNGKAILRNMQTKEQEEIPFHQIEKNLKVRFSPASS